MSFEKAIPFLKFHEGGEVDSAIDSGRHTIYGISSRSFPKLKFPAFWDDPTWDKAEYLYRKYFWDANRLGDLPPHISVVAMDMFVHHAPKDAVKALQRGAGGLKVDGKMGPRTRERLRQDDVSVPRILQWRLWLMDQIVKKRPRDEGNLDGWRWRTQCLDRYSLGLQAGINVTPNGFLAGKEK